MGASITLRGDCAELGRLQAFADAFAHDHGLPSDERARLFIILDELFTNAAMHGRGSCGAIVRVTVALGWQDGRLAIDFLDDAQPFDPLGLPALDLDAAAEERTIGGLGVHIVRSLVEEARYRREGGRNHLHLVRHTGPAASNLAPG